MTEDDEGIILKQLIEATAISEGLRLLINQLQSSSYIHDENYRSLLAFFSELHWRYYQIQVSRKVETDLFGRLRLKPDARQSSNLN